jgi:uncharacterized damage-inducible protein DinB
VNYYGGRELAESFRTVRKNTLAVASDIPEDRYSFRAAPETRSVAELLTHITFATSFARQAHGEERLHSLVGFDFPAFMKRMAAEEKTPRSKTQIIELLTVRGEDHAKWVETIPEDVLAEIVTMPPGASPAARSRFDMLLSVKEHEMHHRAQLMLIERMVGIVPHLTRRMLERQSAATAQK